MSEQEYGTERSDEDVESHRRRHANEGETPAEPGSIEASEDDDSVEAHRKRHP